MRILKAFLADINGTTAIEYGLLAALISVSIIAGVEAIGGNLSNVLLGVSNHITPPN
ncbi:Flp family type IVb pilin [Rhizobium grahamii]|uniref:Flp family type IVb pilin n=1 Tax=Rhizobium grahamii TaxID=1120045 RepID=A0A5Q0CCD1_9HYPH|nr:MULTISPECIES: Flp family type IVb pilin [Rhizobium]QFY61541.1 Flp family type IVb pilin [Rhizobium grahamii]QRM49303.1 Flp family type IVb pilin [Rhizobium sp. BG6]